MAKLSTQEIIDAIKEMKILEVKKALNGKNYEMSFDELCASKS